MRFLKPIIIVFLVFLFLIGGLRVAMLITTQKHIVALDEVTQSPVVLVPGAGLLPNGKPSLPLSDRLDMAIKLYNDKLVKKILVTGDNRFVDYNEPGAMKDYLIEKGIPKEDIVQDFAGRRTYDSCYRAREIFGVEDLIMVTQPYHLPRATFLCNQLGVKTQGLPIDQSRYIRQRFLFWNVREIFATIAAYWDIYITKPLPVLGTPEPIFP